MYDENIHRARVTAYRLDPLPSGNVSLPKAALEVSFVAFAVCEARAGGLRPADTASIQTAVHLRLMETKHLGRRVQ